jgi:hypothetical protein
MPTPRAASPAFGSPIRKDAVFTEEEDEIVNVDAEVELDRDSELNNTARRERRRLKGKERDTEQDLGVDSTRSRERERKSARDEGDLVVEGKLKLQDVTNSPRGQLVLPPVDNNSGACSCSPYIYNSSYQSMILFALVN